MSLVDKSLQELQEARKEHRKFSIESSIARAKKVAFVVQSTETILEAFRGDEIEQVTFKDLQSLKIGERFFVNDLVDFQKTYQDENKMSFLTYMQAGGTFGIHSHDCVEQCRVLKGMLIEKTRGYKIYSEGEDVWYSKGEKHQPYASSDSTYEVIFYKEI